MNANPETMNQNPEMVTPREIEDLCRLCRNSIDAGTGFAEHLNAIARSHGLMPSVLRAYIVAITRDEMEKYHQKAVQMDLLIGIDA